MWPWEHLALGYLLLSITWRLGGRQVDGWVAASLALGTQFPDVDKLLAWYLDVLPTARSLLHSVFTTAAISVLVLAVAADRDRLDLGVAFSLGYVSHLFGDALPKVLQGQYGDIAFLLWPVRRVSPDGGMGSVLRSLSELLASPEVYLTTLTYRTAILYGVVILWIDDGFPGVCWVGDYLERVVLAR